MATCGGFPVDFRHFGDDFTHEFARFGVYGGFIDGYRQACFGDCANAFSCVESDGGLGVGLDFRDDERTVGYVRVIPCVLYDTRGAVVFVGVLACFPVRYGKGRLFALWQSY